MERVCITCSIDTLMLTITWDQILHLIKYDHIWQDPILGRKGRPRLAEKPIQVACGCFNHSLRLQWPRPLRMYILYITTSFPQALPKLNYSCLIRQVANLIILNRHYAVRKYISTVFLCNLGDFE